VSKDHGDGAIRAARRTTTSVFIWVSVVIAGSCCAPGLATARFTVQEADRAAVGRYLAAQTRLSRGLLQYVAAAQGAERTLVREAAQCSGVLRNMPRDAPASEPIKREVVGAVTQLAWRTPRSAFLSFVVHIERLTWHDKHIARAVRTTVHDVRTAISAGRPSLCRDARKAARQAFQRVPSDTRAFVRRVIPVQAKAFGSGPGTDMFVTQTRMRRYEDKRRVLAFGRATRTRGSYVAAVSAGPQPAWVEVLDIWESPSQ
jgi:hypothetical protein